MVPVAFLPQMCALEFWHLYQSHHPTMTHVLCCDWNGHGPHPRHLGYWEFKERRRVSSFHFTRSTVARVIFLAFVNHHCRFCPFVSLVLEDQIGVCKRTRQSRSVFPPFPWSWILTNANLLERLAIGIIVADKYLTKTTMFWIQVFSIRGKAVESSPRTSPSSSTANRFSSLSFPS